MAFFGSGFARIARTRKEDHGCRFESHSTIVVLLEVTEDQHGLTVLEYFGGVCKCPMTGWKVGFQELRIATGVAGWPTSGLRVPAFGRGWSGSTSGTMTSA